MAGFEGSPVLNKQAIESGAQGLEMIAKGLDAVGNEALNITKSIGDNQSASLLYTETNNLIQGKEQAKLKIGKAGSPEEIQDALKDYKQYADTANDRAILNDKDSGTFGKIVLSSESSISDAAVAAELKMYNKSLKNDLMGGFHTDLSEYGSMVFQDPKGAEAFRQSQETAFTRAYTAGLITKDQYNKAIGAYDYIHDGALRVGETVANGTATSFDYHAGTALSGGDLQGSPNVTPVEHFTLDTVTKGNYKRFISDMVNGKYDGATYLDLPKHEQAMADDAVKGYENAVGQIRSNTPVTAIDSRISTLSNPPSGLLSERERIELDTLKLARNEIDNNFLGYISKTSIGATIAQNYQDEMNGINNSALTPEQKQERAQNVFNESINAVVGLGKGMGLDANKIKPARIQDVQAISQGFSMGGDPRNVIETAKKYGKENAYWVGNSIKDPKEAQIVQALAYTSNNPNAESELFTNRMVLANQKGASFHGLNQTVKNSTDDKSMNASIVTAMAPVLNYLKTTPDGVKASSEMVKSVQNFVKYSALANGDTELKNINDYVDEGIKLYQDAYPIQSGANYSFNTNDVDLAPTDIRNIVHMVSQELPAEYKNGDSPFTVGYRGGDIIAVNQYGDIVYKTQYDRHMVSAANHEWRVHSERQDKEIQQANQQLKSASNIGLMPNG